MTAVVLHPLGDATYAVHRNGVDTGVLVYGVYWGWDVRTHGTEPLADVLAGGRAFRRVSQAREWLDSPVGQRWLDERVAEVPR
jgi:hypothetical protein